MGREQGEGSVVTDPPAHGRTPPQGLPKPETPLHNRRMDKDQVAEILVEIGTLLELKGENPFKTRAYAERRAHA